MRIDVIGGGPAGLYFSLLMKKAHPECEIELYERNRRDDTFGWGVVFSDETLGGFREADPETFARITDQFAYWGDIETYYGDTCVRSTGHGFCGLARKDLLLIMQERCAELGVGLHFEHEVEDLDRHLSADLCVAADGLSSILRERFKDTFKPTIHMGDCRFTWLGTTKPLDAFTFIFRENEHGLFTVHAYPFMKGEGGLSTFIVECHKDTFERAGLDSASEEETVAYCEGLFADHLDGHRLLTNRSIWRTFPTIKNEIWHHENVVLLGDSAHTAHFSIGSGTKLAMEDAIALVDAFNELGTGDVPRALERYQEMHYVDTLKIQKAAKTSRTWFEVCSRYTDQHPLQFSFNLMTRSKQITYENLKLRDPDLVTRATEWFADETGMGRDSTGKAPAPMFAPLKLRDLELENRIVVSPMCQYSAKDGVVGDWHLMHLGSRAVGGAALVMTEMTDVDPNGRITHGCAGLWNDEQATAWTRIVDFVHQNSRAKIGIQLAHAGRKASCHLPWEGDDPLRDASAWQAIGPSAEPFDGGWPAPREMDESDMERLRDAFVHSAKLAVRAGFDLVELHMAHGYLLSSFLSPASNKRRDAFGGSLENRMRYPLEVFDAVRAVWPKDKPLAVRVSATDWLDEGGQTIEDTLVLARELAARGCDLIDVSTAGNTPRSVPERGRMYQVPFAERIKQEVDLAVMAVGAIQGVDHANTVLLAGRADLCALARPHLVNPSLVLGASVTYEHFDMPWPKQYLAASPRPRD